MKRLFEPVLFDRAAIYWDYRIRFEHHFRGYYHWHQCPEILLVHEGQGVIIMNRQTFPIRPGMLFFFAPYQLHHVYAQVSPETPYSRSIFYADPVAAEQLLLPFPRKLALFKTLARSGGHGQAYDLLALQEPLAWIYRSYDERRRLGRDDDAEELGLFLLQLLSCLEQAVPLIARPQAEAAPRTGPSGYSETILRWIEEHFREEVRLERLAEETHLSEAYISRIFRRETGSNLTDYLSARRIKHACGLLERTGLSVEQIGAQSGFPNVSHFIKQFKREMGTTPLQYRKGLSL